MIATIKILLLSVPLLLQRLLPVRPTAVATIARDLRVLVSPKREGWLGSVDLIGHLEADLVCRCAARAAASEWSNDKLIAFSQELAAYAANIEEFNRQSSGMSVADLPKRSAGFAGRFEEIVPHILSCDRKVGGEGVQF